MSRPQDQDEYNFLDFSGGLNNTKNALLIADNELQDSSNVFVSQRGGIEKRYGYTNGTAHTLAAPSRFMFRSRFQGEVGDWVFISNGGRTQATTAYNAAAKYSAYRGSGASPTATFTNGSAVVTLAVGTAEWLTQLAASDIISIGDDFATTYTIQSVDSNTQITLTANYAQATTTAAYFVIQKMHANGAGAMDAVSFKNALYVGPALDPQSGTSGLMTLSVATSGNVGTVSSRVASTTRLDLLAQHKNYIFGAYRRGSSNTSRLFWSASLDAATWPASNFVDVGPDDGGRIQGLIVFNDTLYIFKDSAIYYLVGEVFDPSNPTYALRRIPNPENIGTVQHRSLAIWNNRIVFMSKDGIFSVDGANRIENLSISKIRTTITNINSRILTPVIDPSSPVGSNDAPYYWALVFDGKYMLAYGNAGSYANTNVLVLDEAGKWTVHDSGLAWQAAVNVDIAYNTSGVTSTPQAWAVTGTTVKVLLKTETNDSSTAINATADTKHIVFGDFSEATHVHDVYFIFADPGDSNQAATINVYLDGSAMTSQAVTFGTANSVVVHKFSVERQAFSLYLRVSDNTASKTFRFIGAKVIFRKQARASPKVIT